MNKPQRVTITVDVETNMLANLSDLVDREGAELTSLIAKHRQASPRSHVMQAYMKSHDNFASLYLKLAK